MCLSGIGDLIATEGAPEVPTRQAWAEQTPK